MPRPKLGHITSTYSMHPGIDALLTAAKHIQGPGKSETVQSAVLAYFDRPGTPAVLRAEAKRIKKEVEGA
jgi:hypothetical protein